MATDPADAEALRRRLYRPGASPHDLAAYLHAAEAHTATDADAPGPPVPPPVGPAHPLRPFVLGGAAVLAAAALGGALLLGGPPAPTRTPTPAAAAAVDAGSAGPDASWSVTFRSDPVRDGGERDGARGAAVVEGADAVRYTVAAGDTVAAVAERFALCQGDVLLALPYGVDPAAVPPDQVLELSRASTRSSLDC